MKFNFNKMSAICNRNRTQHQVAMRKIGVEASFNYQRNKDLTTLERPV